MNEQPNVSTNERMIVIITFKVPENQFDWLAYVTLIRAEAHKQTVPRKTLPLPESLLKLGIPSTPSDTQCSFATMSVSETN
jgi:hypothetical protein